MKNPFIRIFVFLVLTTTLFSCSPNEGFKIDGVIHGGYKGYLYLNYNNIKDSCLVTNNKFHFEGKTSDEIVYSSRFSTNRISAMDKNFFMENKNIQMDIRIENKKIRTTELDWIIINSISGTKTSLIEKDYENFKVSHQKDEDWQVKHYKKIEDIVTKYPKNQYSGKLLSELTLDSIADIQGLQNIYKKLDLRSQNPITVKLLKRDIFPHESSRKGKPMMNFELLNEKGLAINTKQYRGSVLFVDFWASWCVPCRKTFPKIISISKTFESKNFKILGVSLDEKRDNWIKAIKKDKLLWDNVIDSTSFNGKIATEYGIFQIPSNFLINEDGVIIAINLDPEELKNKLDELLN